MRRAIVIAFVGMLMGAVPCWVNAQRMGGRLGPSGARPFRSDSNFRSNFSSNLGSNFRSNFGSRFGSLAALSLFADPLYTDALYNSGYPVASQPPVIILQNPPAAAAMPPRPSSPSQPLMIELQGDRYVQVSGEDNSGAEMVDRDPTTRHRVANASPGAQSSGAPSLAAQGRNELPPAILVFRDGRREEVSGYTITDGVLYASGDFYAGGSWNRKIELSSLNLAETIESNRSRGIEFRLPAAANEVIVRP